jgi:hypothetical protein
VRTSIYLHGRRPAVAALLLACVGGGVSAAAAPGVPVARIVVVGSRVERSVNGRDWSELSDGTPLRTGDRVRSDGQTLARFEIGWVRLVLSPSSEVEIPPSKVLSLRLLRGRLEQVSEGADIVAMRTPECLVRGKGHVVIRREAETTAISARAGRFSVEAAGRVTALEPGFGLVIRRGETPRAPRALPPAPDGLVPGPDPLYVERNEPVHLEWRSAAQAHQIELIVVGGEAMVKQTSLGVSPASIVVPWPGTYRWRVVALDADGIESLPSRAGLLCVPGW